MRVCGPRVGRNRDPAGTLMRRATPLGVLVTLVVGLWAHEVVAHDPSVSGGLFRTRDAGTTWLHLNPGIFVSGALALAVSPLDPNHLLLATESGVSRSRNGGRDWTIEAPDILVGPIFAAIFDIDSERALVSGASAIFRTDGDRWQMIRTPAGAAPARALVSGSVRGRIYLAGWTGLYRSDDWGRTWVSVGDALQAEHATALLVLPGRANEVYAVAAGRFWASVDGARTWQLRNEGLPAGSVKVVGSDPSNSARMWAVAAGEVFQTDDRGQRWHPVGKPLAESRVIARAIAVWGQTILIATDRGVFRSVDAGERWEIASDNLPAHLGAGVLLRDPQSPATFYAGFAPRSAEELAQWSSQGSRSAARLDIALLVGSYAFLALLMLGAGTVVRRLARKHDRALPNRDA
jgi:photosystem II stability/assembly factor-like uncharacterized protein